MKNDTIIFSPEYTDELLTQNRKLCGLVLDKSNKVLVASIVERAAVSDWYSMKITKYNPSNHTFLIATICIIGEVIDIVPASKEQTRSEKTEILH